MTMTIAFIPQRKKGDFSVSGELTYATAMLALRLAQPLFGQHNRLRFDFSGLARADSAGVALLIEWQRMAQKLGIELRYRHLPDSLQAIIRVVDVATMLPIDAR
jgi:phospholipid transport system transporter-binding protein